MPLTIPNTIANAQAGDASKVEANFAAISAYVNGSTVNPDGSVAMTGPLTLPASDPVSDNQAARKVYVDLSTPAGVLTMFAGAAAPAGWLLCNGAAVSRSTYARLFTAVSTTWGVGDGATTFNVPDLRGRTPIGAGTGTGLTLRTLAAAVGVEDVTLSSAQSGLPAHTHIQDPHFHAIPKFGTIGAVYGGADDATADTNNINTNNTTATNQANAAANASASHTNMQPSLVVNYIIKV